MFVNVRKSIPVLFLLAIPAVFFLGSCAPPKGTFAGNPNGTNTSFSGYIVVSNNATREVILFDDSFNYVRTLYRTPAPNTDVPWGISKYDDENVLITIEGVDRVIKVNLRTGANSPYISDSNVSGTMRGIARLSSGDVLIADNLGATNVERFTGNDNPQRVSSGWPIVGMTTNSMLFANPSVTNGHIACSTGTDAVRTYNASGTQTGSATSAAPGTTLGAVYDVTACAADSSGRIAAAYNGANDGIRLYNNALTSVVWTRQDTGLLAAPLALGVRSNGNFLAVDASNLVVELSGTDGSILRTFSSSYIATVNQILVMP